MEAHIFIDDHELAELARRFNNGSGLFQKSVKAALRRVGGNMRRNLIKGMRGASYLKGKDISGAVGRPQANDTEVSVRVAGKKMSAHRFKLMPNRVTARKGSRSVNWPSPRVAIGSGEPVRQPRVAGHYKPFIAEINGIKAMFVSRKGLGDVSIVRLATPQYFAAFDRVKEPVLAEAQATFMKRLEHEIDYRLGLGR